MSCVCECVACVCGREERDRQKDSDGREGRGIGKLRSGHRGGVWGRGGEEGSVGSMRVVVRVFVCCILCVHTQRERERERETATQPRRHIHAIYLVFMSRKRDLFSR